MLAHIVKLLGRAVQEIPDAMGATWFALALAVGGIAFEAVKRYRVGGWPRVRARLRRYGCWPFISIVLLMGWCLLKVLESDHSTLLARIRQLKAEKEGDGAKISGLEQRCSRLEGANDVLQKQTGDQQTTINNCQTQALKLLIPEPLKITPLFMSEEKNKTESTNTAKALLLVNKVITPVHLRGVCNKTLISADGMPVGSGAMGVGTVVDGNSLEVRIDSPAWTPTLPLLIVIKYAGPIGLKCRFN
jgi:hypothetical protein